MKTDIPEGGPVVSSPSLLDSTAIEIAKDLAGRVGWSMPLDEVNKQAEHIAYTAYRIAIALSRESRIASAK